ncbi:MAG: hypothetical protein R2862_07215 [Thermoanaerobaculia bacterium]
MRRSSIAGIQTNPTRLSAIADQTIGAVAGCSGAAIFIPTASAKPAIPPSSRLSPVIR